MKGINSSTTVAQECAQVFMCTHYINKLIIYNVEVNTATKNVIEHLTLTQAVIKSGIKIWGQKGVAVIIYNIQQIHGRNAVRPLRLDEITQDVRKKAIGHLMFL